MLGANPEMKIANYVLENFMPPLGHDEYDDGHGHHGRGGERGR